MSNGNKERKVINNGGRVVALKRRVIALKRDE
jgi:hypothetical protein